MSRTFQNILVFGGTGSIGKHIVNALVSSQKFNSITIFTSQETLHSKSDVITTLKNDGVQVVTGDVHDEADVKGAYTGIDTVISAVGRNVLLDQVNLLKWAEEMPNVRRFFPSEYGTDIEFDASSTSEKPHQMKLKVRAHINEHVKRLEHTYVVTGPFPEMYINPADAQMISGGFDVATKRATLLGDGNGKIGFTTMPDTGKLVVAALLHPEASRNRALKVNSFAASPNDILAEFRKQTAGDGDWVVSYTSLSALESLEGDAWREKRPNAIAVTLRRIWTAGKTQHRNRDNALVGDPAMKSLREVVAEAIEAQTAGAKAE